MSKIIKPIFGGSESSSSSSSGLDPRFADAFFENYERAKEVGDALPAREFAGFNPMQTAAFNGIASMFPGMSNQRFAGGSQNMPQMQTMDMPASRGIMRTMDMPFQRGNMAMPRQQFQGPSAGLDAAQSALNRISNTNIQAPVTQTALTQSQGYDPAFANREQLGQASQANAAQINQGDVRQVNGGSFLDGKGISEYQNPYTQQVVDQSLKDIERARKLQEQSLNSSAASVGAFGGTRAEIAKAENNRNFLDQAARTSSQLRSQGFDTAANLKGQDLNRGFSAQQANQGRDMNIANTNVGNRQNVNLANQGANNNFALTQFGSDNARNQFNTANQNAASQFGATAQNAANNFNASAVNQNSQFNANNNLAAQNSNANLLQNLFNGGIGFNNAMLGNFGQLLGVGNQQQQFSQQQLDAIRNLPLEQLQIISGALGINPGGGSGRTSTGNSSGESFAGVGSFFGK